jgi:ribonuclease M5
MEDQKRDKMSGSGEFIKLPVDRPVIVEGKFDRERLMSAIDAEIIPLGGFAIFSDEAKRLLITRLAEKNGIIVLTDSDGAGLVIRNHIKSILPPDKIINLYIPQIKGKEKRKTQPSKAGFLGVEGIERETLRSIFAPYAAGESGVRRGGLTKTDLYEYGFSGGDSAQSLRDLLCQKAGLPGGMSANAMLGALNLLYTREDSIKLMTSIGQDENDD